MPVIVTRAQMVEEATLQKLIPVSNMFQYCVYTKGISAAIVLIKSTTSKNLTIKFKFDLTNLVADSSELTVKSNESAYIVMMPEVLGQPIGVGMEMTY